nr:hypothetical protein [Acidaminococcus sp. BV3L6]
MNAIDLCSDLTARKSKLAVVGLGYVGLPLAVQFAKHYDVIGFDTNEKKVARYKAGVDVTGEAGDAALKETDCQFTAQEEALKDARFFCHRCPNPTQWGQYTGPDGGQRGNGPCGPPSFPGQYRRL